MPKKTKIIIQSLIIIILLIALGAYFYSDYKKSQIPEDPKIEIIKQITTFNFVNQDLSQELKLKYQESFDKQAEVFLRNPEASEAFWPVVGLAQNKELVGDYDGAVQALLWAEQLQPQSYVVHGNLGNLYFRHYQDFAKAEKYFLKAIEPDNEKTITYYFDLHEIYRYFYKTEINLAEEILLQGIERYPDNTDLMAVLAHYYKEIRRIEDARIYYQKMLEINPQSQVAKQGLESL